MSKALERDITRGFVVEFYQQSLLFLKKSDYQLKICEDGVLLLLRGADTWS